MNNPIASFNIFITDFWPFAYIRNITDKCHHHHKLFKFPLYPVGVADDNDGSIEGDELLVESVGLLGPSIINGRFSWCISYFCRNNNIINNLNNTIGYIYTWSYNFRCTIWCLTSTNLCFTSK